MVRRKPIQDYDVTLLITNEVLEKYNKDFVIELILDLVKTLEKDLLEIKLNINTQCRIAATHFMENLANPKIEK
jgi:actin related protein 2/3 complex subunit 4